MFDILFARVFFIVGVMLCLTAITSKVNRCFETALELWATTIISLLLIILIFGNSGSYPLNLLLMGVFSLVIGWQIGPAIEYFGVRYKFRKYLHEKGTPLKKGEKATPLQIQEFELSFDKNSYHQEWQNTIFLAVIGTASAVLCTATIVVSTDIDFGFLGGALFICLCLLILMWLINVIFIKSKLFSLIKAYFGAVIFTLYLLYDFDKLKQSAGDYSWSTAINLSVNIYLDIVNLFLSLLEILAESN